MVEGIGRDAEDCDGISSTLPAIPSNTAVLPYPPTMGYCTFPLRTIPSHTRVPYLPIPYHTFPHQTIQLCYKPHGENLKRESLAMATDEHFLYSGPIADLKIFVEIKNITHNAIIVFANLQFEEPIM